jgi:hypothetical protein
MAEGLRTTLEAADTSAPASDPTLPSDQAAPPPATRAGGHIGRYEIGAQLGAGGMGVVHRATDPDLKRPLAIKLVRHAGGSVGQARVCARHRRWRACAIPTWCRCSTSAPTTVACTW